MKISMAFPKVHEHFTVINVFKWMKEICHKATAAAAGLVLYCIPEFSKKKRKKRINGSISAAEFPPLSLTTQSREQNNNCINAHCWKWKLHKLLNEHFRWFLSFGRVIQAERIMWVSRAIYTEKHNVIVAGKPYDSIHLSRFFLLFLPFALPLLFSLFLPITHS